MMKSSASSESLVLAGNSLAVLVAATERAHRGLPTTIVNPGGTLGGYFSGVQALGRRHDAGMMFYEFSSSDEPATPPRLDSYDPMKRNDASRFCAVVRRYVQSYQSTRPIRMPRMWVDGQLLPDMLLGHGLQALPHLKHSAAMHRELSAISRQVRHDTTLWHPSNHKAWPADGSAPADWPNGAQQSALPFDCDTLSRRLHGPSLHEAVFLPFARQMMNRDAAHLAAVHHRVASLPMYCPETLLAVLCGKNVPQAAPIFNYPQHNTVANLCQQLALMVRNHPLITLIEDQILHLGGRQHDFLLMLKKHGELRAARLGWSLSPSFGIHAAGMMAAPEASTRLPLLLGFFRLPQDAMRHAHSIVHAVANDTGIYRVVNSTLCGAPTDSGFTELVIEAHPQRFREFHGELHGDAAFEQAMLRDLATMTLIKPGTQVAGFELRRLEHALSLPTHEAVDTFLEERERLLHHLPGIELIGSCAAPFSTGLTDQIVQGLQLAHRNDLDAELMKLVPTQLATQPSETAAMSGSH